jgi:hypothetical protein
MYTSIKNKLYDYKRIRGRRMVLEEDGHVLLTSFLLLKTNLKYNVEIFCLFLTQRKLFIKLIVGDFCFVDRFHGSSLQGGRCAACCADNVIGHQAC